MNNIICIVTHVSIADGSDIAGPAHTLVRYFEREKKPFLFIRHSIIGRRISIMTTYDGKKSKTTKIEDARAEMEVIRRLKEGITTLRFVWRLSAPISVYIGVDPLNSFWGFVLLHMGKVRKLVVFSADYSVRRYKNNLLDKLYYSLDRLTSRSAKAVLAVSDRILDVRKKEGIHSEKLICIPNSPSVKSVNKYRSKSLDPTKLIMIGILQRDPQFEYFLRAIKTVAKKYPKILLTVVGIGQGEQQIRMLVQDYGLGKHVKLLGPMSHEKLFELIGKNGVGVALYTDDSARYFSDSMKARDYLALGLPTIITGDLGTSVEIDRYGAGIWANQTEQSFTDALVELMSMRRKYETYHQNALRLSKMRDSDNAIRRLLAVVA